MLIDIPTIDDNRCRQLLIAALQDSRAQRELSRRAAALVSRRAAISRARSAERLAGDILAGMAAAGVGPEPETGMAQRYLAVIHPSALRDGPARVLSGITRQLRID